MRTSLPPAPEPHVVGERGTVLFAAGGVGRAAVDGDVWEIHYPHQLSLHAGQEVQVVGQRGDVLLVLPAPSLSAPSLSAPSLSAPSLSAASRPAQSRPSFSPPTSSAPARSTPAGRRR